MALCASCGSDNGAVSCATCGDAAEASLKSQRKENVACAACYFHWIMAAFYLLAPPYKRNRLIRFHAFQSIFFTITEVIVLLGLLVVLRVLEWGSSWGRAPMVLTSLTAVSLSLIIPGGFFVLQAMLAYQAYKRRLWVVPILGRLAEKRV